MQPLIAQCRANGWPYFAWGESIAVCCDCLEFLPLLEAGSVDCVVTDPPYGIGADKQLKERAGKQHGKAFAPSKDYGSLNSTAKTITPTVNWLGRISTRR